MSDDILAKGDDSCFNVIVYAFGDLGIKEGKALVSIPVMCLGNSAVDMASMLCRQRYTWAAVALWEWAKKLQSALSKKHHPPIIVVDPMEIPLNLVKTLV